MDSVLVLGHKNPDTDSICSAIAYAELKNKLGQQSKAVRLGALSKETEYVLNHFNLEAPELINTVRPQISDLTHLEKEVIYINDSLKSALDLMIKENFSSLPVVDEERRLVGMIHVSDIANTYLEMDHAKLFNNYSTLYKNLKSILKGEIICGEYPTGIIKGRLKAASEMDSVKEGDIVVTTTLVENAVENAIAAGAGLVILCVNEGDETPKPMNTKTPVMKVEKGLFKTFRLITQSVSISSIMSHSKKFYQFKEEDFLHEIKDMMKEADQTNFPVVDREGKIYGTIRSKNLINFTRKKVILVDHNEKSQSVDGIDDAKILEVVDHHKFGNFETNEPLLIRADTVGCSSTIIFNLYKEEGISPSREVAGIMLSAILSDTLLFKSPTCTEKDIKAAKELAEILGFDYEKYGMDMLIAGTSLGDKSPMEIITMDMKEFKMSGLSVAVAQVNTVDVKGTLGKKEELESVMSQMISENGYDAFILAITDIINAGSQVIALGQWASLVESGFNTTLENNSAWLEGVVSRKKQLVPFLMAASQSI
ncbi:putative manganese-dependent inorganic diphosphatase [uncultured Ilyobacter sp.]|jgi:manganese-dependent inorganic pyrophosphatase|uniref:putative manganese-dependent inorganic diphosphatase n=1 Tax=uncultured Ilyobacter sp. TaxID=544433 RepID=UPI0029BFB2F6|nr:putative manganese-dependent inorganic diphosphatase [uncultured Ilyobacter sp.]